MNLRHKRVLIFAAYGAISGEVARQAAKSGAEVLLSGRDAAQLETLRAEIEMSGGKATAHVVDATDRAAVCAYLAQMDAEGGFDAVFNGIGLRAGDAEFATPSPQLSLEKYRLPLDVIAGSTFLTAALAAPFLAARGGGSIVTLSAALSGSAMPMMAGISAACGAIEATTRSLAGEFGPRGVRVNCVRATAMPETRTIQETGARFGAAMAAMGVEPAPMADNLLHRPITVADTAQTIVFLMSDGASGMTGQVVNVCGGTLLD